MSRPGASNRGADGAGVRRPPIVPAEIETDLHGMTVEVAVRAIERHLERAHAGRLHIVKIVHGHGTGALKSAAREALARSPLVKRHYSAGHGDGGDGVTIAELDYGREPAYNRRSNNAPASPPGRRK